MIIIDGSHLLHRQLHVPELSELKDSYGNCTGGIHGFIKSLSNVCYQRKLREGVIVAWDDGVPVHRRQLFSEYKPKKTISSEEGLTIDQTLLSELNQTDPSEWADPLDEDFLQKYQFSRTILHQILLPNLGCISVQVQNCEADDIISVWCNTLRDKDNITILSSDRDLNQLLSENVEQFDAMKGEFITVDSVIEKYGLEPDDWREEWLIGKAILGDGSDGIPGFFKVGEKAARHYAKQFLLNPGMKAEQLERAPRTPAVGLENLTAEQERIWVNKKLMDLNYIIDNKLPLLDKIKKALCSCNVHEIDYDLVEQKLNELQMRKAKEFIDNIADSNDCDDLKQYLGYFIK